MGFKMQGTLPDRVLKPKIRDRHGFSELESFITKPPQIRFRIVICAIKNLLVKKNRVRKAFSY